jgi:hypothetical protein
MMASTTLRSKLAQDAATVGLDPFLGKTSPTAASTRRGLNELARGVLISTDVGRCPVPCPPSAMVYRPA